MIRRVSRKLLPALLILGWISLSVFDVLEDLDEAPGQLAVAGAPGNESTGSKRGGWGPLANNLIESASRSKQPDATPLAVARAISAELVLDSRKSFRLHKLYHIFLI